MTSDDHTQPNMDDRSAFQPCDADRAALEAMVESGWDLERVPEAHKQRAAHIMAILRLAGTCPTDDQGAAKLVDSMMARLPGASGEPTLSLTPDDEEALDAWQLSEHRLNRVPGSLRERAAKIEAIGALLTNVPAAKHSETETTALLNATMARLERDRAAAPARQSLRFERAPTRRYKLGDLVSIAAMLTLGAAVIWPIIASGRTNMQQIACRGNFADVATGMGLYGNDNRGALPMASASLGGSPWWDVGVPERSNSANLYTLAHAKYAQPAALACAGNPFCNATKMTCQDKDWCSLPAVSYSFRIMFGGKNPTWDSPNPASTVVLSDKSPVVMRAVRGDVVFPTENSPNHDGRGQNVLTLDGSTRFMTTPVTAAGDNIWLPRGIEDALAQIARSLKPGQSGFVEIHGWVGPKRMDPIKGIETPADENDSFVGP